jgi:hypothetical protein
LSRASPSLVLPGASPHSTARTRGQFFCMQNAGAQLLSCWRVFERFQCSRKIT